MIVARGGSKRIPRKNIRDFLGRPIIRYVIDTALESGLFGRVLVSTEDEEIAGIAREGGASVPFMRSRDASNDHATTAQVMHEVLKEAGLEIASTERVDLLKNDLRDRHSWLICELRRASR